MTCDFDKQVERLIEQYILANQTILVLELLTQGLAEWEEIENLYDESTEAIEEYLTYETDLSEDHFQNLDHHERLNLAQERGFEPQVHEIYEWWLVSDWMADKLSEFEEPILRTDYGTWWGRTCTGQAIKLDGTVQKIVKSLS